MCPFVPFYTFDPVDLAWHMLAEDLHHPPFLVSEIVPLHHRLGSVSDVTIHQIRVPSFADRVLQGVGLKGVPEVFWSDITGWVPFLESPSEQLSVGVVISFVVNDFSYPVD